MFGPPFAHSNIVRFPLDPSPEPTFIPANTSELSIGEKIVNGDLKWHPAANEWTEIQTIGYRTVQASQKGLFRRRLKAPKAEDPDAKKIA